MNTTHTSSVAPDSYPHPGTFLCHAPPMVLLNRTISCTETTVICEVDISPCSRFADASGVPAWVGLEYMAQTIGVFAGIHARRQGYPLKIGFLLGSRNITLQVERFSFATTLVIFCELVWDGNQMLQFDCNITQKIQRKIPQKVLMNARLNVYSPQRTPGDSHRNETKATSK